MNLALHIIAMFANLALAMLAVGVALKAPSGAGGFTFGLIAVLCAFNMYAHIQMADGAS